MKHAPARGGFHGELSDTRRQGLGNMSGSDLKTRKIGLWGLFKEVFNWYPSDYPTNERKYVVRLGSTIGYSPSRLLFKLDLSILVFACLCCKLQPRGNKEDLLTCSSFRKIPGYVSRDHNLYRC